MNSGYMCKFIPPKIESVVKRVYSNRKKPFLHLPHFEWQRNKSCISGDHSNRGFTRPDIPTVTPA